MPLSHIDHAVLTVADVEATVDFYRRTLGMEAVSFSGGRRALAFGQCKINSLYFHDPDGNLIEVSNYV